MKNIKIMIEMSYANALLKPRGFHIKNEFFPDLKGNIKESKFIPPKANTIEKECSICKDTIHERSLIRLSCKHYFHKDCINEWFKIRNNCPLCRKFISWDSLYSIHREWANFNLEYDFPSLNVDSII